jgi:glucokinase
LTNIINIFQPDVVCIGGGISKEGETLVAPIREYVARERYSRNIDKQTEIKAAVPGNDAGIIGAAFLGNIYR